MDDRSLSRNFSAFNAMTTIGSHKKHGWTLMDIVAARLDAKLREWTPTTAEQVRQRVEEIIDLADQNALDVWRSRAVEQAVLALLDEPTTR
jgi:hypothetical protein